MTTRRATRVAKYVLPAILASSATAATAYLLPPVHFHLAGTDASNYANAAEQYRHGADAGRRLLPDGIANDGARISGLVLADKRGMLTPFVFVQDDGTFSFAHRHLSARLTSLVESIRSGSGAYLNYGLLMISAFLIGLLVHKLGFSNIASWSAGTLAFALPSHLELARYPMSEPLATTLALSVLVLAVRRNGDSNSALAALPLAALPHVRSEFTLILLLAIIYLAASRPRMWLPACLLLVASSWIDVSDSAVAVGGFSPFRARIVPDITWPSLAASLHVLTEPGDASRLVASGLGLSWVAGKLPGLTRNAAKFTQRIGSIAGRNSYAIVAGLLGVVAAGDAYKATLAPGEIVANMIRPARYGTGWLIWESAGPIFVVAGLIGLAWSLPRLIERLSPIAWIVIVPLLGVLIDMHATPANQLWWTRRFHMLVYPALIVGTAAALDLLGHTIARRTSNDASATRIALLILPILLAVHVVLVKDRLPPARDGYMSADVLDPMHQGFAALPAESFILFYPDAWGQKAVVPARTFHGLYAFVVWEPDELPLLQRELDAAGLPIFVDRLFIDESYARRDRSRSGTVVVPVFQTEDQGREIDLVEIN